MIPAAGLGTRFLPATKASPKEMLPLVDKPLIQYVVEEAVASGIREIIIITGRGKRAIEDHFDVSPELEVSLRANGKRRLIREIRNIARLARFCYVRQNEPRGLGHAVLCARHLIGDEPFAVLLGDDILSGDRPGLRQMVDVFQRHGDPVLAIQEVAREDVRQYGIIHPRRIDHRLYQVLDLVEKPSPARAPSRLAVIGRYILTPDIFAILSKVRPGRGHEVQLTDALRVLAGRRTLYGLLLEGKRHDAGDKLGFLKATVDFGLQNRELGPKLRRYLRTLKL